MSLRLSSVKVAAAAGPPGSQAADGLLTVTFESVRPSQSPQPPGRRGDSDSHVTVGHSCASESEVTQAGGHCHRDSHGYRDEDDLSHDHRL
jgi:hypothetical protein